MSAIVLVGIALSALVVGVAIAALGVQEAFHPRFEPAERDIELGNLPILAGDGLRRWGERLVRDMAARDKHRELDPQGAIAMVTEIKRTVSGIAQRLFPQDQDDRRLVCYGPVASEIPVTVPEVLAIAEDLRQHHSAGEIERIRRQAQHNSTALGESQGHVERAKPCPLYRAGDSARCGTCAAYESRPIFCRSHGSSRNATRHQRSGDGAPASREFADSLGEGVLRGLTTALSSQHYDGQIYELNAALATALGDRDAADRWGAGEPVFAHGSTIKLVVSG